MYSEKTTQKIHISLNLNLYIQFYSLAGHRIANNANMHFYTASKHATTVLSDGLRNELNALEKQFRVTVSGLDHAISEFK